MPTKAFLDNLASKKVEKFSTMLDFGIDTYGIKKVHYIKLLENGQKEICLIDSADEHIKGVGDSKAEALAECISLKYPA